MRERDFIPAKLSDDLIETITGFEKALSSHTGEKIVLIAYSAANTQETGNQDRTVSQAGGERR